MKKALNPEIQVHFIQQHKLKQQLEQQNKLHIELLRVKASQKQASIYQIAKMSQNQLMQYFTTYQLFPQAPFTFHQLKQQQSVKLIKNNNKIYFGQVINRQMVGKGICYYMEGKVYEGTFIGNKRQGVGCEIYQNGNLYIGEFSNNKKNGRGQFFWFSVNNQQKLKEYQYYDGLWWGGLPDGQGIHQKANGDFYQGSFKNGLKHGYGEEKYANGDIYKGQFINGLPEGIGSYFWKDGSFYRGDFKQGLRNGYGLWQMNQSKESEKYEGHYLMDKKEGYGEYTWMNGWVYKGNFQNDKRQGYGQLFDHNACVFKGQWSKGQKYQPLPNNIVKISRVIEKHNIRYVQKQQFQIDDISKTVNLDSKKYLTEKYKQHQLLTRPGFLVRRPTKGSSININKHQRCNTNSNTHPYTQRNDKNTGHFESQSTIASKVGLTSRVGTSINRPISKTNIQPVKSRTKYNSNRL